MVASYSGSVDGTFLPSRASAPLIIYETCDKYTVVGDHVADVVGTVGSIIGGTVGGGYNYPNYGNGYGGNYPDGHYFPPGTAPSEY